MHLSDVDWCAAQINTQTWIIQMLYIYAFTYSEYLLSIYNAAVGINVQIEIVCKVRTRNFEGK